MREAIARADVVLSGGGGLLQTATSARSIVYYAGILREAIRQRRKSMIFAQSIGPLDFLGRIVVRSFCRGLDRATVRDARSLRLLAIAPAANADRTNRRSRSFSTICRSKRSISRPRVWGAIRMPSSACARSRRYETGSMRSRARSIVLPQTHGVRVAFLPLGGASDAEVSTIDHSVVQERADALAGMPARARGGDSARRARRHRHAAARADPGGALRRAVSWRSRTIRRSRRSARISPIRSSRCGRRADSRPRIRSSMRWSTD